MGGIDTIHFVPTKSRVAFSKKKRIMHLMKTRTEFAILSSLTWEDISARESVSRSAISIAQHDMDETLIDPILPDYEAPWAVLQLVSMDRIYLMKTAYNLFNLMRLGNCFSETDKVCS